MEFLQVLVILRGTYVCNDVMYSVLHYCHTEFKDVKGGFMHVPFATEQTVNHQSRNSWNEFKRYC